jgi:hypothetical protein
MLLNMASASIYMCFLKTTLNFTKKKKRLLPCNIHHIRHIKTPTQTGTPALNWVATRSLTAWH